MSRGQSRRFIVDTSDSSSACGSSSTSEPEEHDISYGDEESDVAQPGYLWCVFCGKEVHEDSFSAQRLKGPPEERYCLRHTSTSDYGRSYIAPPKPSEEDGEKQRNHRLSNNEDDYDGGDDGFIVSSGEEDEDEDKDEDEDEEVACLLNTEDEEGEEGEEGEIELLNLPSLPPPSQSTSSPAPRKHIILDSDEEDSNAPDISTLPSTCSSQNAPPPPSPYLPISYSNSSTASSLSMPKPESAAEVHPRRVISILSSSEEEPPDRPPAKRHCIPRARPSGRKSRSLAAFSVSISPPDPASPPPDPASPPEIACSDGGDPLILEFSD